MLVQAVVVQQFSGGEHRPFDYFFQFPEISRPGITAQMREQSGRDVGPPRRLALNQQALADAPADQSDVFWPLAQRCGPQAQDVESVVENAAKVAVVRGGAQVLMSAWRRGFRCGCQKLRQIRCSTLVIHGDKDLMVATGGGIATVNAIPGAKLVLLPEMGHDFADSLNDTPLPLSAGHRLSAACVSFRGRSLRFPLFTCSGLHFFVSASPVSFHMKHSSGHCFSTLDL